MTARWVSSTTRSPFSARWRISVVLPTPGPPVKRKKFGFSIIGFSGQSEARREFGVEVVRGICGAVGAALAGRAALEFADLDGLQALEVEALQRAHRGGVGAREEVDALALDRAADVGGVPVAVVRGAVGHLQADGLLDEEHAARGDQALV